MKNKNYYIRMTLIHILMIIVSLTFLLPLCLVVTASLTKEADLRMYGYRFFSSNITWDAYKKIIANPTSLINAYKTTAIVSAITAVLGTFLMCMTAYPLSRKFFTLRKISTFYLFFPMLFGGGLIPSYIINTQVFHLGNTYAIYTMPRLIVGL